MHGFSFRKGIVNFSEADTFAVLSLVTENQLFGQGIIDPFVQYWGQATSDSNGQYQFKTIVPGFYPADIQRGWFRPPHIHLLASAVGFPQFVTQLYFRGEQLKDNDFIQQLNDKDYLLQNLPEQQRSQLVVTFARDQHITDGLVGNFDIVLDR